MSEQILNSAVLPGALERSLAVYRPILIVEDDPHLRAHCRDVLEMEGYPVVTACHTQAALDYLVQNVPPAAIFLDLWLPVIQGDAFLKLKQMNPSWAEIPVYVFASQASRIPRLRSIRAVMRKPMEVDDILDLLEEFSEGVDETQILLH